MESIHELAEVAGHLCNLSWAPQSKGTGDSHLMFEGYEGKNRYTGSRTDEAFSPTISGAASSELPKSSSPKLGPSAGPSASVS